jgi:Ca2+-binding RTX toxin-like protein
MVNTINGTSASETLHGTDGDDNIYGKDGNDIIIDDKGDDWLFGGNGDDTLTGGSGVNDYWGDAGADTIKVIARGTSFSDDLVHGFAQGTDKIDVSAWGITDFGQIKDLLYSDSYGDASFNAFYDNHDHVMRVEGINPGALTAADFVFASTGPADQTGTPNDDVLFGSAASNTLRGGGGNDILLGGSGDDTLVGGFGLDDYDGGAGTDRVSYAYSTDEGVRVDLSTGTTTFSDGAHEHLLSIENLDGSQVNDTLIGDGGRNALRGMDGNDRLIGGGGKDTLTGGLGADTMSGNGGADVFVYGAINESPASGRDTITDFATGDHIKLTGLEASSAQNLHFIGGAAFSHTAGELQVVAEGSNTAVNADIDGDGAAEFSILLSGSHTLTASDFLL